MTWLPSPRQSTVLDQFEVAWAGGLFEGEGTITIGGGGAKKYPRLMVQMTDVDAVIRFHHAVGGIGTVTGPYFRTNPRTGGQYKPQWQWSVHAQEPLKQVVEMLWPYLGLRRKARAAEASVAP